MSDSSMGFSGKPREELATAILTCSEEGSSGEQMQRNEHIDGRSWPTVGF